MKPVQGMRRSGTAGRGVRWVGLMREWQGGAREGKRLYQFQAGSICMARHNMDTVVLRRASLQVIVPVLCIHKHIQSRTQPSRANWSALGAYFSSALSRQHIHIRRRKSTAVSAGTTVTTETAKILCCTSIRSLSLQECSVLYLALSALSARSSMRVGLCLFHLTTTCRRCRYHPGHILLRPCISQLFRI